MALEFPDSLDIFHLVPEYVAVVFALFQCLMKCALKVEVEAGLKWKWKLCCIFLNVCLAYVGLLIQPYPGSVRLIIYMSCGPRSFMQDAVSAAFEGRLKQLKDNASQFKSVKSSSLLESTTSSAKILLS